MPRAHKPATARARIAIGGRYRPQQPACARKRLLWRNSQVLSRIDLVRMRQHRLVRLENFLIRVSVAVKLFRDLGQRVAFDTV